MNAPMTNTLPGIDRAMLAQQMRAMLTLGNLIATAQKGITTWLPRLDTETDEQIGRLIPVLKLTLANEAQRVHDLPGLPTVTQNSIDALFKNHGDDLISLSVAELGGVAEFLAKAAAVRAVEPAASKAGQDQPPAAFSPPTKPTDAKSRPGKAKPPAKSAVEPEPSPKPALVPDLEQAGQFIGALTGSRDTVVTFQTFDDNKVRKDKRMARIIHGTLPECSAQLTKLNAAGAGIFVTINETDGKGRKAGNIVRIRAVWGDFDDDGVARAQAAAEKLPPSIEVESSPGKRQTHWLADGIEPYGFAPLMDALTPAIGADPDAKTIERVLRLPGFFHRKGEPVMVKLLSSHPERRYTEKQIAAAFDLGPITDKPGRGAAPQRVGDLAHVLTERQVADAREVIAAMREKGLHISGLGHGLWHKVGLALCLHGEIGEQLFDEFSQGDSLYDKGTCRTKIEEKRTAVAAGTPSAVAGADIGNLFKIAGEHDIANPAAGRKPGKHLSPANIAALTAGNSEDAGTNLAGNLFSKLTLTEMEAAAMVEAKFWIPDMIVRGHITAFPAPSGGGKTTLFIHFSETMAKAGASVFYINVDSPPDKLKQQQAHAAQHCYTLVAPDAKVGVGISDALDALNTLADSPVGLHNIVLILDTLKKFITMLSKDAASAFYKLLRKISAKGATICLLSHTNKYLTSDGDLIFEGTGDQRTDIDDMIYIYSSEDEETKIISLTTSPDKVRAIFNPRSFRIHRNENLRVEECAELLPIISKDELLVLKKTTEIIRDGVTVQRAVVDRLIEETPYGRDRLRTLLFNLSEGSVSPLVRRRDKNNNAVRYSVRGEQREVTDF